MKPLYLLGHIVLVLIVLAVLQGCSVTVSYDLPSKTIQDYFFKKGK
jgi:uncharacterized protein YceK